MSASAKKNSPIALRLALGLGIGGLALWLALREVDPAGLSGIWQRVDPAASAAALAAAALSNLGKAARWRALLAAGGPDPGFSHTLRLFFAGQFANLFVPGRLGDFGRALGAGGRGPGAVYALGTVAIEKALDVLLFALLAAVLLLTAPLPEWLGRPVFILLAVAALVGLGLWWFSSNLQSLGAFLKRVMGWLPVRIRQRLAPQLQAALGSLEVFRRQGAVRRLLFWTAWIWGLALAVNHLGLLAFGLSLPLTASLLLLLALQIGFSAVVVPAALGVFEFLCVLSLAVFGVGRTDSFGAGVLLHAIVLAPVLAGGVLALLTLGAGGSPKKA